MCSILFQLIVVIVGPVQDGICHVWLSLVLYRMGSVMCGCRWSCTGWDLSCVVVVGPVQMGSVMCGCRWSCTGWDLSCVVVVGPVQDGICRVWLLLVLYRMGSVMCGYCWSCTGWGFVTRILSRHCCWSDQDV